MLSGQQNRIRFRFWSNIFCQKHCCTCFEYALQTSEVCQKTNEKKNQTFFFWNLGCEWLYFAAGTRMCLGWYMEVEVLTTCGYPWNLWQELGALPQVSWPHSSFSNDILPTYFYLRFPSHVETFFSQWLQKVVWLLLIPHSGCRSSETDLKNKVHWQIIDMLQDCAQKRLTSYGNLYVFVDNGGKFVI